MESENIKKEIIRNLEKISGKYSMYEVFSDWIKCGALAVSNGTTFYHDSIWHKREQEYLNTVKKYENDEVKTFADMLGLLALALEEKPEDVLGWIYMTSGMGSKAAGQFFTPYHLSELCAGLLLPEPHEDGKIYLNEPSCGGGGMIIASVTALKNKGFDYQKKSGGSGARSRLERCVYVLFTTITIRCPCNMCTRRYAVGTVSRRISAK